MGANIATSANIITKYCTIPVNIYKPEYQRLGNISEMMWNILFIIAIVLIYFWNYFQTFSSDHELTSILIFQTSGDWFGWPPSFCWFLYYIITTISWRKIWTNKHWNKYGRGKWYKQRTHVWRVRKCFM